MTRLLALFVAALLALGLWLLLPAAKEPALQAAPASLQGPAAPSQLDEPKAKLNEPHTRPDRTRPDTASSDNSQGLRVVLADGHAPVEGARIRYWTGDRKLRYWMISWTTFEGLEVASAKRPVTFEATTNAEGLAPCPKEAPRPSWSPRATA